MKEFKNARIRLYYNDLEEEKVRNRSFNHVIEGVTVEQIKSFQEAVQSLTQEVISFASIIEEQNYL